MCYPIPSVRLAHNQVAATPSIAEHYNRNQKQGKLPTSPSEAVKAGFVGGVFAYYHRQGGQTGNIKFVHPDGREAIYNEEGKLVTNPVNRGTFNFNNPKTDKRRHIINDVVPYILYGNTPDDLTSVLERVLGSYSDDVNGRTTPTPEQVLMMVLP